MRRVIAVLMFAAVCARFKWQAQAQSPYPSKPSSSSVRVSARRLRPTITHRLLALEAAGQWGSRSWSRIRPGAGANIGTAFVAHAAPETATPCCSRRPRSRSARAPLSNAGYDALKDFAPVMMVSTIANVLACTVGAGGDHATRQEFSRATPRAHPGKKA
jgi:hypothetical protein